MSSFYLRVAGEPIGTHLVLYDPQWPTTGSSLTLRKSDVNSWVLVSSSYTVTFSDRVVAEDLEDGGRIIWSFL